jgi:RNA-directed DNA polymerase
MCHSLFQTGTYHRQGTSDSISELAPLEGRLTHIHYVKARRDRTDEINKEAKHIPPVAPDALYRRFLLYKHCIANPIPTIITEGRSDIIYLRAAIRALAATIPTLVTQKNGKLYPCVSFLRHTEIKRRVLDLSGGTGGIAKFIQLYRYKMKSYGHAPMLAPVIIVTDNDDGADCVFKSIKGACNITIGLKTSAPFYHLHKNLYLVKTPVGPTPKGDTSIEDLFPPAVLNTKVDGKSFDKNKLHGDHSSYGKIVFADKVIRPNASTIDFSRFRTTLEGIAAAITHYKAITTTPSIPIVATTT